MNYKEFISCIRKRVEQKMNSENVTVILDNVVKSGDLRRDCISIHREGCSGAPVIYMDDVYELYKKGESIETITDYIIRLYENCMPYMPVDIMEDYSEWEHVRDHITCRLINARINSRYLEDAVYIEYLDLAIVIYCTVITERKDIYSSKVSMSLLDQWGVDKDELYKVAMENNKRLFGIQIREIRDALFDITNSMEEYDNTALMETLDNPERMPMFILTNHIGNQGAVNIFMEDTLKAISGNLEDDLYIIPSSIHEVLIVPKHGKLTKERVDEMIKDINLSLLDPQDILSNHVYEYSRTLDRIIM